jgi:hypothetical protein
MSLPDIEPFGGLAPERYALLSFMEYWSEELRAAGWYMDLEYFLLDMGSEAQEIHGVPPGRFIDAYRWLVDQAGGWFTHGPSHGREFVEGTFEDLVAARARHADAVRDRSNDPS